MLPVFQENFFSIWGNNYIHAESRGFTPHQCVHPSDAAKGFGQLEMLFCFLTSSFQAGQGGSDFRLDMVGEGGGTMGSSHGIPGISSSNSRIYRQSLEGTGQVAD